MFYTEQPTQRITDIERGALHDEKHLHLVMCIKINSVIVLTDCLHLKTTRNEIASCRKHIVKYICDILSQIGVVAYNTPI